MDKIMKIGILGTGGITHSIMRTVGQLDTMEIYAVASRTEERAKTFAEENGIPVHYGTYLGLVQDPNVDLVYVATPHSEHFNNVSLALENGKHVLCEKAFTLNAAQAQTLIDMARERKLYLAEAVWARYQPAVKAIRDFVYSGIIGEVTNLDVKFVNYVWDRPRIHEAALGGGALLDLGVYCINFCRAYFGTDVERTVTSARLEGGVDVQGTVQFWYRDGKLANATFAANAGGGRTAEFFGTKGRIVVDQLHHPRSAVAYSFKNEVLGVCDIPAELTGYEYELWEAEQAIREGRTESVSVPLAETLAVMQVMDGLRKEWGLVFPQER